MGSPVVICAPSSCYSTMDITKDGDIAIFYEDNACTQGYALNYAVFPIDWIVPGGDPSAKAFQEALAKAKAATTNEGYTDEATAKAGQYSQEAIDNVKSLIATYEASVTDYEAATAALNAAVEAMGKQLAPLTGITMRLLSPSRAFLPSQVSKVRVTSQPMPKQSLRLTTLPSGK